jgi:hypothetical protein
MEALLGGIAGVILGVVVSVVIGYVWLIKHFRMWK